MNRYTHPDEELVGTLVYRYGSPQKTGKIIELIHRRDSTVGGGQKARRRIFAVVKVKWLKDGEEQVIEEQQLKDFRELIADHERKLKTHKKMLKRLEAME